METIDKKVDFTLLTVRIVLGIVIGAHGAQKLLGWFGGFGFEGSIEFFTHVIGLPYLFALLIILAESLGMVALIVGLFSRVMAGAMIVIMTGALITVHSEFGFFMNWFGNQAGEGFEFDLIVIALSLVVVLNGSGVYSLDHLLNIRLRERNVRPPGLA
jgi:putative oxidoreductase